MTRLARGQTHTNKQERTQQGEEEEEEAEGEGTEFRKKERKEGKVTRDIERRETIVMIVLK